MVCPKNPPQHSKCDADHRTQKLARIYALILSWSLPEEKETESVADDRDGTSAADSKVSLSIQTKESNNEVNPDAQNIPHYRNWQ